MGGQVTELKRDRGASALTLTPIVNLESPNNLTCVWTVQGSQSKWRKPTQAQKGQTNKLHTVRPQSGLKPGTFLL